MFDNKYLVNLYVLSLDKSFEIFIPVDEKIGNVIKLINKTLFEMSSVSNNLTLLSLYSGNIYNYNDLVRNTDIKNGTKLILI